MNNELKICTWNIKLGQYLPTIIKTINKEKDFQNLDVVALQESYVHNNVSDAAIITSTLGDDYTYFKVDSAYLFGRPQSNAIIWNKKKLTVINKNSFTLPNMYEVTVPVWEKTLLRAIPKQKRTCLFIEGVVGKKTFRIYSTHLDVIGFTHKRAQLNAILTHAKAQSPVDITCITGDLNTFKVNSRPRWRGLTEDTELSGFKDLTNKILWTFSNPVIGMQQKLDSIFVSPAHVSYTSWSLDVRGSDHIPLFSNIDFSSQLQAASLTVN